MATIWARRRSPVLDEKDPNIFYFKVVAAFPRVSSVHVTHPLLTTAFAPRAAGPPPPANNMSATSFHPGWGSNGLPSGGGGGACRGASRGRAREIGST